MQTQRDHMHAYQFSANRLLRSLTDGDPGTGEGPLRRANLGAVFGVLVAVLLSGGAVLYGLLNPGGDTAWRRSGAIVVEKETGTRFVYLGGVLRPTANYASARLIAGSGASSVTYVSQKSLASVPHGQPVGIPNAPDSLPPASALLPGSWAWCLRPGTGQTAGGAGPSGSGVPPQASTVLDLAPAGRTSPVPVNRQILVTAAGDPSAAGFVLWNDVTYPLGDRAALVALGLGNQQPVLAPASWLATMPAGPAFAPAVIRGAGKAGPAIAGRQAKVGELFQTSVAGAEEFYVLRPDGLAPITRTEAALFAIRPGAPAPVTVGPADIAAAPASSDRSLLHRLPDPLSGTGTTFDPGNSALCVLRNSPGQPAQLTVVTEQQAAIAGAVGVLVPAGRGMLAEPPPPSPSAVQRPYLITDSGRKYAITSGSAVAALGYSSAAPVMIPDEVLQQV